MVDNFLKKKKWKAVHSPINSNESAVKYFSAVEKIKYYENTQCADESESDVLLSYDDETEQGLAIRAKDGGSGGGAQYSLLANST